MTNAQKKREIKKLTKSMLKDSLKDMQEKIDKALNSGAIDIDSWDNENGKMILPKTLLVALLENESTQYLGKGTDFEKKVRKDANNIKYFL